MSPIRLDLPAGPAAFHTIVLDFTGTLSLDGTLLPGVADRLRTLAGKLEIIVLTADTFGTARAQVEVLPVEIRVIRNGTEKAEAVSRMGPEGVIAIGNGRNDIHMMAEAGLGIAVLGPEGVAADLITASDLVVRDINDALDLILNPLRLKATLRD